MSLLDSIGRDIRACLERDPAARSSLEVIVAYPGFHARQFHRVAHSLWNMNIPVLPRFISHIGRWLTGIEIHPAAVIGEGLFIDHGMGVVIGETTIIGDDCTLYQGVTLGGVSTKRTKRHPTLGNRIVIGAGAQLLGSITLGDDVKVGAGSVVIQSVPPNATVIGVPGRIVAIHDPVEGTIERLPDPISDAVSRLQKAVEDLTQRINAIDRAGEPDSALAEIEALLSRISEETPSSG
jgi:serine O-acetyltransferase